MSEPEPVRQDSPQTTSRQIRRAIDGDLDSLDRVVGRLSPLLLAQASYRLGSVLRTHCDPEDLVQEAWLIALPRLGGLPAQDGRHAPVLLRFLSTSILHLVRNLARKHVLGSEHGTDDDDEPDPLQTVSAEQSGVVTKAVRAELVVEAHRQLDDLDDLDRRIVILRGIEQQSNATVGVVLGMEPKTVSKRYRRALQKLRSRFPRSVFEELDTGDVEDT